MFRRIFRALRAIRGVPQSAAIRRSRRGTAAPPQDVRAYFGAAGDCVGSGGGGLGRVTGSVGEPLAAAVGAAVGGGSGAESSGGGGGFMWHSGGRQSPGSRASPEPELHAGSKASETTNDGASRDLRRRIDIPASSHAATAPRSLIERCADRGRRLRSRGERGERNTSLDAACVVEIGRRPLLRGDRRPHDVKAGARRRPDRSRAMSLTPVATATETS